MVAITYRSMTQLINSAIIARKLIASKDFYGTVIKLSLVNENSRCVIFHSNVSLITFKLKYMII